MDTLVVSEHVYIIDDTRIIAVFHGTKSEYDLLKDSKLVPEIENIEESSYTHTCGNLAIIQIHTTEEAALKQWEEVVAFIGGSDGDKDPEG